METKIIKGDLIKESILNEVKTELQELKTYYHKTPGIAFIGFWGAPLSKYNIPLHIQLAEMAGFKVFTEIKTKTTTETEMFSLIDELNHNDDIHHNGQDRSA